MQTKITPKQERGIEKGKLDALAPRASSGPQEQEP